jgi:hypothetical protein
VLDSIYYYFIYYIITPPGAWMFVCCECCVLSGRGLCDELITRPEESYRLWCVVMCDLENLKNEEAMTRVGSQRHIKKKLYYNTTGMPCLKKKVIGSYCLHDRYISVFILPDLMVRHLQSRNWISFFTSACGLAGLCSMHSYSRSIRGAPHRGVKGPRIEFLQS